MRKKIVITWLEVEIQQLKEEMELMVNHFDTMFTQGPIYDESEEQYGDQMSSLNREIDEKEILLEFLTKQKQLLQTY